MVQVNFPIHCSFHCVKSVQIRNFSGPYFPAFGLNTERFSPYSVRMRVNTDQKKLRIWTLFTQCFLVRFIVSSNADNWRYFKITIGIIFALSAITGLLWINMRLFTGSPILDFSAKILNPGTVFRKRFLTE